MPFCRECGSEVTAAMKFCPECAAPQATQSASVNIQDNVRLLENMAMNRRSRTSILDKKYFSLLALFVGLLVLLMTSSPAYNKSVLYDTK
ncbi:MAG: hypothetical protein QF454_02170, partial [Candidatus Thalassarchaeaceae archaeon]|nr:hypothetical protein [Candidatus Thalassarchaeaceae archaeon]